MGSSPGAGAIVLISGGMDSAVALYSAMRKYDCKALIFDYGQKSRREIAFARELAKRAGVEYHVLKIDMPWKGSALLDEAVAVPDDGASSDGRIPATYVPARNMIFLSFGVSFAEAAGAEAVFIGAHQMDFSNYPDCRSEFLDAFGEMVKKGTKAGVERGSVNIVAPLINMTKKEIVEEGIRLGVPFELTWSCYAGGERPCGRCESCVFREKAFRDMGVKDPVSGT
ncbi:MAG: 7-cyano-7-deazaguanine synthase QueC [Candidatus Omnitrophica bacterium]|nr:7-cyano-7-deazaguanine synthase QueC [Candidatus Omnitrophota bacterium]MDD5487604.1 7-cyano-7-deazaguanine synthase QueC [Candidatus Omnitrophota bacterium]